MGETTKISWCDATFNPWIGCAKVSPGCAHCYAEAQNKRYNWTGGWGAGQPRKLTSEANWRNPISWARKAAKDGVIRRVFCASLADVFDDEVPQEWRDKLFSLILWTGDSLEWLLLTKRPENIAGMLPSLWRRNPPPFVRIGVTTENQEMADKRIIQLLQAWHGENFISVEPMLGQITLSYRGLIDWVICGGESGPGSREMNPDWVYSLRAECLASDIPFFFKQLGGHPDKRDAPADWPADLRVQQFPKGGV